MINLEEGAPEFLSGCNPMSIIQKRIRFGSLFVVIMLTLHILSGTASAAANDGIVLSPEDDSSVSVGCVMVDGNVSQDYADTVFLELENAATGAITELLVECPYSTSLWLPEGNYYVHAALSGDHFEIQYPSEITVSRYKAASLSLTVTLLELPSLLEKRTSFVPKLPIPYPQRQMIWNYLLEITGNAYAAAGLMGNLYAESGLVPTNLQDACEASLGYEDGTYTEAVDSGTYSDFATDWAGYGLAQWTWQERKQNLLAFSQDAGMSVGSLDLQLRFVAWELEERGLLSELQAVRSVREASDLVLFRYEAPLDTSANIQTVRCGLSMTFYNRFAGTLSQGQKDILETAANPATYGIPESNVGSLQWVKLVYEAAGVPFERTCCAYHSGAKYAASSDWNAIAPGAVLYGYGGSAGHAGIYMGNGMVCHCDGTLQFSTLDSWITEYQGYGWGWPGGIPA